MFLLFQGIWHEFNWYPCGCVEQINQVILWETIQLSDSFKTQSFILLNFFSVQLIIIIESGVSREGCFGAVSLLSRSRQKVDYSLDWSSVYHVDHWLPERGRRYKGKSTKRNENRKGTRESGGKLMTKEEKIKERKTNIITFWSFPLLTAFIM